MLKLQEPYRNPEVFVHFSVWNVESLRSSDNFPSDQEMQLIACQAAEGRPLPALCQLCRAEVLRRVYIRAREMTMAGSRVVTLGKQLEEASLKRAALAQCSGSLSCRPEVWTFHGLARILTSMKLFPQDAEIQLECCVLLASIGELLHNNGYATEVFKILELAMRKHGQRAPWQALQAGICKALRVLRTRRCEVCSSKLLGVGG